MWSHSGQELFYKDGNNDLIAAEVDPDTFAVGEQRALFSTNVYRGYRVAADDEGFVMIRLGGSELIVVENFFEELKAKVGN